MAENLLGAWSVDQPVVKGYGDSPLFSFKESGEKCKSAFYVVFGVRARNPDRFHGTRQYYGLFEAGKHKREGRGRIRHGVRPVEDKKSIVIVLLRSETCGDHLPVFRGHV